MNTHYRELPRMTDSEFYDRVYACLVSIKAIADLMSVSQENDIIVCDDTIQHASIATQEAAEDALYLLERWLADKKFSHRLEKNNLILMAEKDGETIYRENTRNEWWLQKSNGAAYELTENETRKWFESKRAYADTHRKKYNKTI